MKYFLLIINYYESHIENINKNIDTFIKIANINNKKFEIHIFHDNLSPSVPYHSKAKVECYNKNFGMLHARKYLVQSIKDEEGICLWVDSDDSFIEENLEKALNTEFTEYIGTKRDTYVWGKLCKLSLLKKIYSAVPDYQDLNYSFLEDSVFDFLLHKFSKNIQFKELNYIEYKGYHGINSREDAWLDNKKLKIFIEGEVQAVIWAEDKVPYLSNWEILNFHKCCRSILATKPSSISKEKKLNKIKTLLNETLNSIPKKYHQPVWDYFDNFLKRFEVI